MSSSTAKQHENFEIKSDRLKVVRQDRVDVSENKCWLEFDGIALKVINISSFGVLVEKPSVELNDEFDATIFCENHKVGEYQFKKIRAEQASINAIALETQNQPIAIEQIEAAIAASELILNQDKYQDKYSDLPDNFIKKVYEIKDWLEHMQEQINEMESKYYSDDKNYNQEFEKACSSLVGVYLNKVIPTDNKELQSYVDAFDEGQLLTCFEFFREKLGRLIYQAPFSNRVFYKPLGYAGDYEMMNIIYRDEPAGKTLFAKCLHEYWVKCPAAQAVRNRAQYMNMKLRELLDENDSEELNILAVACGPAKEWQDMIVDGEYSGRKINVDLLDQDENALKYANRKMKELSMKHKNNFHFSYMHKAIKNIIGRGLNKKYDLIYSAGLFDYFTDPVVKIAGAKLFEGLKEEGKLIIGNFNVGNPNSIGMELILDWKLIYRTEKQLHDLFSHTGGKIYVEKEPLNINLFSVISKK